MEQKGVTRMDIYEILMYVMPAAIVVGLIIHYGRKILRWSDNNNAEITEHKALLVDKSEKERVYSNKSTGGTGIPVTSTRYYLVFMLDGGKKQRFEVPMADYIKADYNQKGVLKLRGTRFVGFEKTEGNEADE